MAAVARELGIPHGTARSRLHYALHATAPAAARARRDRVPDEQPHALGHHRCRRRWREGITCRQAQARPALIAVMLLTAAALDLTRCGLVLAAARHPVPTAELVAAGLAAAVLSRADRARMPGRPALGMLGRIADRRRVGPAGGRVRLPRPVYDPDTATAALGVLLAVAVLATAGAAGRPGQYTENPCTIDRASHLVTRSALRPAAARRAQADTAHGPRAAPSEGDDVRHSGHCQSASARRGEVRLAAR